MWPENDGVPHLPSWLCVIACLMCRSFHLRVSVVKEGSNFNAPAKIRAGFQNSNVHSREKYQKMRASHIATTVEEFSSSAARPRPLSRSDKNSLVRLPRDISAPKLSTSLRTPPRRDENSWSSTFYARFKACVELLSTLQQHEFLLSIRTAS